MIYTASPRESAVFTYWLDKHMIRKGVTAMAFMRLCDAGKVPGFAPDDWPSSDTVIGAQEEQREETSPSINVPALSASNWSGPTVPSLNEHG